MDQNVQSIIEKWYRLLRFPPKYDAEFYGALEEICIPVDSSIETYDVREQDGKKNFLSYLYFCEKLEQRYAQQGIDNAILMDTLHDLVLWTDTWSGLKGQLYLGELAWLKHHLSMKLFKLGRLQFAPGGAEMDVPRLGISKGDPMMEIHVPAVGPLDPAAVQDSVERAKAFFAKYYPEYAYRYFTCHSWLLDTSLKELLGDDSNIIRFQNLFDVVHEDPSDAALRYVFQWNTTKENVGEMECTSSFAKKVKERAMAGRDFYVSYGIIL